MATYVKTSIPGVYVRHRKACPAASSEGVRCRCAPSYRAQRRGEGWSPTFKTRDQAVEWKSSTTARASLAQETKGSPTFGALAREWWAGVESGAIGKRKGRKGIGYSDTTLAGYRRSLFNTLLPTFEDISATALDGRRLQAWIDKQAHDGLSRSRIANHVAVLSAIYGWASRASRRIVPSNPALSVELPPNDEKPRERVATSDEAARLLGALESDDQVPYALAFYAGLRRSEIHRLAWNDVDLNGLSLTVRRAKSDAGAGRRIPIATPLKPILEAAANGDGAGPLVCSRSVMSGKLSEGAYRAWGWKRKPLKQGEKRQKGKPGEWVPAIKQPMEPIGLHECRHTYASLLVAAHYTLKEVMVYMGHADLTTTSRYVKRLPQPSEGNPADRLNAYLAANGSA
jgi:integrase